MLNTETVQHSRRLLLTILVFTAAVEVLGAISLLGLWPDKPPGERPLVRNVSCRQRLLQCWFFSTGRRFSGDGRSVAGVGPLSMLIILVGLGFSRR